MKPIYAIVLFFLTVNSFGQCWSEVAAGEFHTLAIKSDGTLWAWGLNDKGQLGDGTTIDKNTPTQIGIDNDWAFVDSAAATNLALKTDGSLWSWGNNFYGQGGDGNHGNGVINTTPIRIGTDTDWIKIASGDFAFAIKSNGTLWGWGANVDGYLGTGETEPHYAPFQIGVDSDWIDVNAGSVQTLALKADHTLWGWGLNKNGSLSIGAINNFVIIPTQTGNGTNDWAKIAVGGCCSSKMIKIDGSLWTMGAGNQGNNGTGNNLDVNVPTQVGDENGWSILSTSNHSHAIKNNATLWAWGLNLSGQLGDGNLINKNVPEQIGNQTWLIVRHGLGHTVAIDANGTIYTWGRNNYDQLGDGTLTNENVPTQIGSNCSLASEQFSSAADGISIYPNPATDQLTIITRPGDPKPAHLNLYSIVGEIVFTKDINSHDAEPQIDMRGLGSGVYLLKIQTGSAIRTFKVIKQ